MSREEAKRATLEFNHKFKVPERDKVIEQDTRHLERKQYLHKNETILEFLDISHDKIE